jgi:hypothetical protein
VPVQVRPWVPLFIILDKDHSVKRVESLEA